MTRTVLLTGFGPFPGIPVNASGLLVPRLAKAARARFPGVRITTAIVPTEWRRGLAAAAAALRRAEPDIVLHFGVSQRAEGFVIERRGVNACVTTADGAGHLPPLTLLDPHGPAEIAATLPVDAILRRLVAAGLPTAASDDAGQYLCNAVLYQSLSRAGRAVAQRPMMAGFIHIPASLVGDGPDQRSAMPGCPLTHATLIEGSLEIIAVCLEADAR